MTHARTGLIVAAGMLAAAAAPAPAQTEKVWRDGQWVTAAKPQPGTPEGELAIIRLHLRSDEPKKAIKAAEAFLKRHPSSPLREEALLLAGNAHMRRGDYLDAWRLYEQQVSEYPGGEFFEQALARQYEIGEAFLEGRRYRTMLIFYVKGTEKGIDMLTRIAEHAPGSDLARNALMRIGDHYYGESEWANAVDAYDNYVRLFDRSPSAGRARLQAARATFAQFIGTQRDDTPLLEARQRFLIIQEMHPQLAEEKDVAGALAEIADARGQKMYEIARYYRRVERPRAAAFYARIVLDEFGQTRWAQPAQDLLTKLGADASGRLPDDTEVVAPPITGGETR